MFHPTHLVALVSIVAVCVGSPAPNSVSAATIPDLYNTGVDGFGLGTSPNTVDIHYTITSPVQNAIDPVSIPGSWVADNAFSHWIVPNISQSSTTYTYETTFTLPTIADLSSVVITGVWATDNPGLDLRVNTFSTGLTNTAQFMVFTPFTLDASNSVFQFGTNTVEFDVRNFSGPTGLRVDQLNGTFVPEPCSGMLLLIAMSVVGSLRKSLRKTAAT